MEIKGNCSFLSVAANKIENLNQQGKISAIAAPGEQSSKLKLIALQSVSRLTGGGGCRRK